MIGYSVKIRESSEELTARQSIKMKDTTDAVKLDEVTQQGELIITPRSYVILDIHNEKADDKDYVKYLIMSEDGEKFETGSESFWSSFIGIWDEMSGENEEWQLKIYRMPSKNYKGKEFLTCSIV